MRPIHRSDERGQVLLFVSLVLVGLTVAVLTIVNVSHIVSGKMRLQTAADVAAKSAATWQARTLNEISVLNCAILNCYGIRLLTKKTQYDNPAWANVLKAQAESFSELSLEILGNFPWQAASDAYTVAYMTASNGKTPQAGPHRQQEGFPRENFGAIVITGEDEFPPQCGLMQSKIRKEDVEKLRERMGLPASKAGSFGAFIWGKIKGGDKEYKRFFKNVCLLGMPMPQEEWQKRFGIKSVAWRRKESGLFGPIVGGLIRRPGICISQAVASNEDAQGEFRLFCPKWKSRLEKCSANETALRFAFKRAGLHFAQKKSDLGTKLIYH